MAALPPVVGAVVILVLVGLSAFFSSSETAIFTLTEESLTEATDSDGDDRAALTVLRELKSDPHRLLVTLLVGNNVVNVAIASLSTALLLEYTPAGAAVTLATVLASFLVLIFGEIVPKSYGLANARTWSLVVARPISVVERVLYPLVLLFDLLTRRLNRLIGGDHRIETPLVED